MSAIIFGVLANTARKSKVGPSKMVPQLCNQLSSIGQRVWQRAVVLRVDAGASSLGFAVSGVHMLAFFEAARANLVAARIAQQDLIVAFAAIGVDYMELHPVIHRAIRKEAMVRGAEAAAAQFVSFASALDEGDGTPEEKANILREIYRVRADGPYTPRKSASFPFPSLSLAQDSLDFCWLSADFSAGGDAMRKPPEKQSGMGTNLGTEPSISR